VKNLSKPNRESSLQVLNQGTFKLTFFAFLFHVINITHFVSTFYIAFNHYFTISISHYFHCLTFSIISLNPFLAISIILLFPLSHFPTQISLFPFLAISIISLLPFSYYFHCLTMDYPFISPVPFHYLTNSHYLTHVLSILRFRGPQREWQGRGSARRR